MPIFFISLSHLWVGEGRVRGERMPSVDFIVPPSSAHPGTFSHPRWEKEYITDPLMLLPLQHFADVGDVAGHGGRGHHRGAH